MAGGKTAIGEVSLEFTPTWVVAVICSIIVIISLSAERFLHYLGKKLKKKRQNALYEALLKVKEELMLLGFISLMLVVFQGAIHRICVSPGWMNHMQPCKKEDNADATARYSSTFFQGVSGGQRRLLAGGGQVSDLCISKGKVPLLSLEAIHKLHIFIFILAITHVLFSAITMVLASTRIRQWRHWEQSIQDNMSHSDSSKVIDVRTSEFIQKRFKGFGKDSSIKSWLYSFGKQFYGSIRRSDYTTMRLGFIMTHCRGNPTFNFYKYMIRALETDFKKVVGLSWYLWVFVCIFLLLNIDGWHSYFWLSLIPLILLLLVGTKLEHVIGQLARDVAEKHVAIEGELVINPSDEHFWFHRPRFVLYLIHFILFQNAFDIAFFFWILTSFGFKSCIMGDRGYVYPRLILSVIIQIICSYSTLPLYAIVTQMGSSFKKSIFDENVQGRLLGWARTAKRRTMAPMTPHRVREGSPDALLHNTLETGEINNEEGPHRTRV